MRRVLLVCALAVSLFAATSWGGNGSRSEGTDASTAQSKQAPATIELVYQNGAEQLRTVGKASHQQARRHGGHCPGRASSAPDL
jgi:hypothetical protein